MFKLPQRFRNWIDGLSAAKRRAKKQQIVLLVAEMRAATSEAEKHNATLMTLARSEFTYKVLLRRVTERLDVLTKSASNDRARLLWTKRLVSCQQALSVVRRKINIARKKARAAEARVEKHASHIKTLVTGTPHSHCADLKHKLHFVETRCAVLKHRVSRAFTANSKFYNGARESELLQTLATAGLINQAIQGA